jgi:hypothetical protein
MIAITTNNSINVKPRQRGLGNDLPVMSGPFRKANGYMTRS